MDNAERPQRRNNRGRRRPQQRNTNPVYQSNGPDVRIRGTAHQIVEKYEGLAHEAENAKDAVMEQSYLQHAEHYQREINARDQQRTS